MIKTIKATQIGQKTIVFADDADLSVYPANIIDTYEFEYESPRTGQLIQISDLLLDYNLRTDLQGNYSQVAYRLAYSVSFARTVCSKITTTINSTIKQGNPTIEATKPFLDRVAVEALPVDVLYAFSQAADPTTVANSDLEALFALRVEAIPLASE
jgi:hypothetical protein